MELGTVEGCVGGGGGRMKGDGGVVRKGCAR